MASPNTLELRSQQRGLRVREIPVDVPPVEPNTHVAVSVEMRRRSYLLNIQRRQRIAVTNQGRDIPVGGPGRRRAKAHRNQGLCLHTDGGKRCGENADRYGRCPRHLTPEFLRSRGEHQLAALLKAGGTLTRGRQYEGDTIHHTGSALDTPRQPADWDDVTEQFARILGEPTA